MFGIVRSWFDVRCVPLRSENILDTHNMFIRPTKNFLFASEVRLHHQNRTFSWIFHIKVACLRSNSGVPNSKNEELITFVAIKNDSYIVWSSHLFLRIALNPEKSSSVNLIFCECFRTYTKIFSRSTKHFIVFAKIQLFTCNFCWITVETCRNNSKTWKITISTRLW